MRDLNAFEKIVEELFEGKLAHLLGGKLQPIHMANLLARALEDNQVTNEEGCVVAPNRFTVSVNADDFRDLHPFLAALQEGLAAYVTRLAATMHMSIVGCARVSIVPSLAIPPTCARVVVQFETPRPARSAQEATRPMRIVPNLNRSAEQEFKGSTD